MDSFNVSPESFSGFVDAGFLFPVQNLLGPILAVISFFAIFASNVIQMWRIVKSRSGHGISPISAVFSSVSQFFLLVNLASLHGIDLFFFVQQTCSRSFSKLMTIANLFSYWFFYLPVVIFVVLFRQEDSSTKKDSSKKFVYSFFIFVFIFFLFCFLFILEICLSVFIGTACYPIFLIGRISGSISALISLVQYVPQFFLSTNIETNGSLSISGLTLQSIGLLITSMVMIFINNQHISLLASPLIVAFQQIILVTYLLRVIHKPSDVMPIVLLTEQSDDSLFTDSLANNPQQVI